MVKLCHFSSSQFLGTLFTVVCHIYSLFSLIKFSWKRVQNSVFLNTCFNYAPLEHILSLVTIPVSLLLIFWQICAAEKFLNRHKSWPKLFFGLLNCRLIYKIGLLWMTSRVFITSIVFIGPIETAVTSKTEKCRCDFAFGGGTAELLSAMFVDRR